MNESAHNTYEKCLIIRFPYAIIKPNAVMIKFSNTPKIMSKIPITLFTMLAFFIAIAVAKIAILKLLVIAFKFDF